MVENNPKRNRYKDNPYYLSSDKENNIYVISFSNDIEKIDIEVSKELFELMDQLEKNEAKKIQKDKRYLEQSQIMEITLYKRVMKKPKSLEDSVIEIIENENLRKTIDILSPVQRRRLLLYYKHNLSFSEIAKIEGCNKMAVKFSIDYALKKLRENLKN